MIIGLLTGFFASVFTFSAAWQLVHAKDLSPGLQHSLQGTAVIRGILTSICFAIAGWVGLGLLDKTYLLPPLLLASLVPFIDGFQHLDAWKQLKANRFRSLAIVEFASPVGSLIGALVALSFTQTIWVVPIVAISGSMARLIVTHIVAKDPWKGHIRVEDVKPILKFGVPLIPAGLLSWLNSQGDKLLLMSSAEIPGVPTFSLADLGAYGTVAGMIVLPRGTIVKTMKATIVPKLSALQGEPEKLKDTFRRLTCQVANLIGWGILIGAAVGSDVFRLILGPEFRLGTEVAPILILGMGLQTSRSLIYSTALAVGRTTTQLAGNLGRLSGLVFAYIGAVNGFGLVSIAISVPVGEAIAVLISIIWVEKAYGSGIRSFLGRMFGFSILASAVMIATNTLPEWQLPIKIVVCLASVIFGARAFFRLRRS